MIVFPAIDLYEGKAVRLYKGDYSQCTVYSERPAEIGLEFIKAGARHIHLVDLEGARDGGTPNLDTVIRIKEATGAFCEIGGGIRSMEVLDRYLSSGIDRGILGTAAVTDEGFLKEAVAEFGEKVAVGADLSGGYVMIRGWIEKSGIKAYDFFEKMKDIGVRTIICTDISKDGAMQGTNRELYRDLMDRFDIDITASGGVSAIDDVRYLADLGIYGAIIGKAYYTGAIDLKEAVEAAGAE